MSVRVDPGPRMDDLRKRIKAFKAAHQESLDVLSAYVKALNNKAENAAALLAESSRADAVYLEKGKDLAFQIEALLDDGIIEIRDYLGETVIKREEG